jgi:hypothetical protein
MRADSASGVSRASAHDLGRARPARGPCALASDVARPRRHRGSGSPGVRSPTGRPASRRPARAITSCASTSAGDVVEEGRISASMASSGRILDALDVLGRACWLTRRRARSPWAAPRWRGAPRPTGCARPGSPDHEDLHRVVALGGDIGGARPCPARARRTGLPTCTPRRPRAGGGPGPAGHRSTRRAKMRLTRPRTPFCSWIMRGRRRACGRRNAGIEG